MSGAQKLAYDSIAKDEAYTQLFSIRPLYFMVIPIMGNPWRVQADVVRMPPDVVLYLLLGLNAYG